MIKAVKNIVLITIPISLLVIILIELLFRLIGPAILFPYVEDIEIFADPSINEVSINSDYYPSKEKSVSWVFLGDSFLTPIGIHQYQLFPYELKRIMENDFNMNFNIINLGKGGFGTGQELEAYNNFINKDTSNIDLVFLMFYMGNDLLNNCFYDPNSPRNIYRIINDSLVTINLNNFTNIDEDIENFNNENKQQDVNHFKHFITQLYTYRFIVNRIKYMPFIWYLYEKCFGEKVFNLSSKTALIYNSWNGKYNNEWAVTNRLIKLINRRVAINNSRLLVIIIPDINQVIKESFWLDIFNKYNVPQDAPNKILKDYLKLNNIEYLDLFEYFYNTNHPQDLFIKGNWHWNYKGIKLAAEKTKRYLITNYY